MPAETAPVNEILVLTNGERVSGTSLNISDGVVNWKMPYGSVIDVPLPLVDRIEQVREIPEPEEPAVKADPTPPPVAEPPPKEKAQVVPRRRCDEMLMQFDSNPSGRSHSR